MNYALVLMFSIKQIERLKFGDSCPVAVAVLLISPGFLQSSVLFVTTPLSFVTYMRLIICYSYMTLLYKHLLSQSKFPKKTLIMYAREKSLILSPHLS